MQAGLFDFALFNHRLCFFNRILTVLGPCDRCRVPWSHNHDAVGNRRVFNGFQLLQGDLIGAGSRIDSAPESKQPPSGQNVKWAQPSTPGAAILQGQLASTCHPMSRCSCCKLHTWRHTTLRVQAESQGSSLYRIEVPFFDSSCCGSLTPNGCQLLML